MWVWDKTQTFFVLFFIFFCFDLFVCFEIWYTYRQPRLASKSSSRSENRGLKGTLSVSNKMEVWTLYNFETESHQRALSAVLALSSNRLHDLHNTHLPFRGQIWIYPGLGSRWRRGWFLLHSGREEWFPWLLQPFVAASVLGLCPSLCSQSKPLQALLLACHLLLHMSPSSPSCPTFFCSLWWGHLRRRGTCDYS